MSTIPRQKNAAAKAGAFLLYFVISFSYMKNKNLIIGILIGAVVVGGIWLVQNRTMPTESAVSYNCELSGGEFKNGECNCPNEELFVQASEPVYDKSTGFCQSAQGGPAGDAFNASVGLPYNDFSFYTSVVSYQCNESGGEFLTGRCDCGSETYDETTGLCK